MISLCRNRSVETDWIETICLSFSKAVLAIAFLQIIISATIKYMRICPSILEYKAKDYLDQIERLSPYYQYFQIDFADGILVDNKTATLDNFINEVKKNYSSSEVEKLDSSRQTRTLTFDFHFMVKDYETEIQKLEKLKNIPFLQIMSIIPGAQGKPFIPETLNKIEQLRLLSYRKEIFLDGLVNDQTMTTINSLKFKLDVVCPTVF